MGKGGELEISEIEKGKREEKNWSKWKVDIRNTVIERHCNEEPSIINRLDNSKQRWEQDNGILDQYLTTRL